jgi:hypothetical protein
LYSLRDGVLREELRMDGRRETRFRNNDFGTEAQENAEMSRTVMIRSEWSGNEKDLKRDASLRSPRLSSFT